MSTSAHKPTVMVSSTVHGIRPMLRQIEGILTVYGLKTVISDRSTLAVDPRDHNFDSCLRAVDDCDVFVGIITPRYGSAQNGEDSITHCELKRAIEQDKPRFMLCHQSVITARVFLNTLSYGGVRLKGPNGREKLTLESKSFIEDLRTIDMLEAALRENVAFEDRTNHWVAEYESEVEVHNYIRTNFDPEGGNRAFWEDVTESLAAPNPPEGAA